MLKIKVNCLLELQNKGSMQEFIYNLFPFTVRAKQGTVNSASV